MAAVKRAKSVKNNPMSKIVVLADLRDSRKVPERNAFEKRLKRVVAQIRKDQDCLLQITQGIDLLVGVTDRWSKAYLIGRTLNRNVAPERYRVGIGRGAIDVEGDSKDVNLMDGPAFHRAADALEESENLDLPYVFRDWDGGPHGRSRHAGSTLALVERNLKLWDFIETGWTKRAREIYALYRQTGRQEDVAKTLGISQPAVSKALNREASELHKATEATVEQALQKLDESLEG